MVPGLWKYIKKTYLIGEAQERFAETLKDLVPIEKCFTLEKAISHAYIDAKEEKNAVVLLSPACASFDQFRDYEHRGETFIELVKRIDS